MIYLLTLSIACLLIQSTLFGGEGGSRIAFKFNISKYFQLYHWKIKILKYFACDCVQNGKIKKKGRLDENERLKKKYAQKHGLNTFSLYMGSLYHILTLFGGPYQPSQFIVYMSFYRFER